MQVGDFPAVIFAIVHKLVVAQYLVCGFMLKLENGNSAAL